MKSKKQYQDGKALFFRNIDYLMLTWHILRKNYEHLADCMVPIGEEQIGMSRGERAELLRSKTRRFSEGEIGRVFYGGKGE